MSDKLTQKQEAFVAEIAKGANQSDAYRAAYNVENTQDHVIWVKASELAANGKVAVRLFELQQKAQERTLVTVESLTKEYEEARQIGVQEAQSAAMSTATTGKARLHGLDKQNITHDISDPMKQLLE